MVGVGVVGFRLAVDGVMPQGPVRWNRQVLLPQPKSGD